MKYTVRIGEYLVKMPLAMIALKNKIYNLFENRIVINVVWILGGLFLICLFHLDHAINPDEGVILNGAWNLYNGRHLYKDFFEFIPPAGFYLIFGVWKIFGVSFAAAKLASMLFFFLGVVGLYQTVSLCKKNKYIWIVPLIFIIISSWWWIINHNVFNLVCLIWATYFILKGLNNGRCSNFIGAGLLTGLAVLFLQQKALALGISAVTFLLFLAWKKRQALYLKSAVFFTLATLLPILILGFWPLNTIYYNLVVYPLQTYRSANQTSPCLLILYALILFFLIIIVRTTKIKSEKIWFLIYLQFWLLLTTYVLPDAFHIGLIIFPSLIIFFVLVADLFEKNNLTTNIPLAMLTIVFISYSFGLIVWPRIDSGTLFTESYLVRAIKDNCPGPYLYAGPYATQFYFETRKLNATPYGFLISTQQTPAQFYAALEDLIKNNPSCAILSYPETLNRFRHDKNNVVETYIRTHYKLIYNFSD